MTPGLFRRTFLATARKDATLLLRDTRAFTTLFAIPLVFLVVMTLALGRVWGTGPGANVVQQNVPAWALFGVFFIAQPLAASLLEERRSGTALRLAASPAPRSALLLGKLVPFFATNLLQVAAAFAAGALVLPLLGAPRLDLSGRLVALAFVAAAASLAAGALGLLLASVARTPEQASSYASLTVLTMAALGGVMVPRAVMPPAMKAMGLLTPHAWALDAFKDVLVRGASVSDVATPAAVLVLFALAFGGAAAAARQNG